MLGIEGVVAVRVETWEKLRKILANRYGVAVDDKTVMEYILRRGDLYKDDAKYGVFFDIDGENVILEF